MRHDYVLKAIHNHRLRPAHFPLIPAVIFNGRVICDKPRHLTFLHYETAIFGGWLQVTVKSEGTGQELWISTFHVASAKEAKRMTKKYGVIRPEK